MLFPPLPRVSQIRTVCIRLVRSAGAVTVPIRFSGILRDIEALVEPCHRFARIQQPCDLLTHAVWMLPVIVIKVDDNVSARVPVACIPESADWSVRQGQVCHSLAVCKQRKESGESMQHLNAVGLHELTYSEQKAVVIRIVKDDQFHLAFVALGEKAIESGTSKPTVCTWQQHTDAWESSHRLFSKS